MFCISFSQTVYRKARDLKNVTGNTTPKNEMNWLLRFLCLWEDY